MKHDGKFREVLQGKFVTSVADKLLSSPLKERFLLSREWMVSENTKTRFEEELAALLKNYDQVAGRDLGVVAKDKLVPLSIIAGALPFVSPFVGLKDI